ncbi:hypothetical protein [Tsukamurella soli]|uniref:hypothetical protein n=1 Tax=Tsukamurella soli TaxID=644556 RepID=UPI003623694E
MADQRGGGLAREPAPPERCQDRIAQFEADGDGAVPGRADRDPAERAAQVSVDDGEPSAGMWAQVEPRGVDPGAERVDFHSHAAFPCADHTGRRSGAG